MSSTTIRVTPTSRGNFSKLRKYKAGNKIEKYQTPADSLHKGVTYNDGSTWHGAIFSKIQQNIQNELAAAQTPEQKAAVIEKYNTAQTAYAALRPQFTDLSKVSYNEDVKNYQNLINTDFSFINNLGINNGITSKRYNYLSSKTYETGDRAGSWTPDGWWGAQTQDRTSLGYRGDWDENSEEFKAWQNELSKYGMETYLDEDGAYKLRLKSDSSQQSASQEQDPADNASQNNTSQENTSQENTSPGNPDYAPITIPEKPEYKGTSWTDWIPLTLNLTNDLIANRRYYNDEVKKKFPLQEAPYQQAIVTNNYAGRQIRSGVAANIRSRANQNLSSNAEYNLAKLDNAENQANQLEEQNALDQTQHYNETSRNVNAVANINNQAQTAVANVNRQQNAAAYNNILAARQRFNTKRASLLDSYNSNMYTSHGLWAQNDRLEENRFNREWADYEYSINAQNEYDKSRYKALDGVDGIYKSQAFATFVNELEGDTTITDILDENGNISIEKCKQWAEANPNDERVIRLKKSFENEYNGAYEEYSNRLRALQQEKLRANLSQRVTETNQGSRWLDRLKNRRRVSVLYSKSGGKTARFVDYMEHYRKSQADVKKVNTESQKLLQKQLDRDLGLLDKETLLLLKSVFK